MSAFGCRILDIDASSVERERMGKVSCCCTVGIRQRGAEAWKEQKF